MLAKIYNTFTKAFDTADLKDAGRCWTDLAVQSGDGVARPRFDHLGIVFPLLPALRA
jgi:hypothetical protein